MKQSLLFCLFFVVCACGKRVQSDGQYGFPQSYDLAAKKVYDTEILSAFPDMFLVGDTLMSVCSGSAKDGFIRLYSMSEGFREVLDGYGTMGRGPGEFVYAEVTSVEGNRLYVENINMSEMAWLDVSEDGSKITETRRETYKWTEEGRAKFPDDFMRLDPLKTVHLKSGYFAGLSYLGPHEFFSLWDDSLNFVRYFGDSPVPDVTDFYSALKHLKGHTTSKDNKFAFAPLYLPYLTMYEVVDGEPVKKWEQFFIEPHYAVQDGIINFYGRKSFGRVTGLRIGERYVYLSFLDVLLAEYDWHVTEKALANIVFVFDHDGNKVARLNLDHRVADIEISSDERTLYGIAATPEFRFVEYKLPEFDEN